MNTCPNMHHNSPIRIKMTKGLRPTRPYDERDVVEFRNIGAHPGEREHCCYNDFVRIVDVYHQCIDRAEAIRRLAGVFADSRYFDGVLQIDSRGVITASPGYRIHRDASLMCSQWCGCDDYPR